jgi:hypothetical protein
MVVSGGLALLAVVEVVVVNKCRQRKTASTPGQPRAMRSVLLVMLLLAAAVRAAAAAAVGGRMARARVPRSPHLSPAVTARVLSYRRVEALEDTRAAAAAAGRSGVSMAASVHVGKAGVKV